MSEVFDIADRYCEQLGALDPCSATYAGIAGHDHEMTDYSPDGRGPAGRPRARHARGARRRDRTRPTTTASRRA